MGRQKPSKYDIIDRQYPVRLTFTIDPEQHDLVRQALQKTVGEGNYASAPKVLWSGRAYCLYFYTLFDAGRFMLACPQARLKGERYPGPMR